MNITQIWCFSDQVSQLEHAAAAVGVHVEHLVPEGVDVMFLELSCSDAEVLKQLCVDQVAAKLLADEFARPHVFSAVCWGDINVQPLIDSGFLTTEPNLISRICISRNLIPALGKSGYIRFYSASGVESLRPVSNIIDLPFEEIHSWHSAS